MIVFGEVTYSSYRETRTTARAGGKVMKNKQYLDCRMCRKFTDTCIPIGWRRCSNFLIHDGWWQCERCKGYYHNPKFDNPDIQDMFDAVTVCSDCLSLEMAKDEIQTLRARVADLETELNRCTKSLERVDFTSGCNGQMCVSGHIETLINCVKHLEAAQEHKRKCRHDESFVC